MKIFWLTPESPIPTNTGGRKATWEKIKELAKCNEIHLFMVIDSNHEEQYRDEIAKVCTQVHLYKRKVNLNKLIKSLFVPYPATTRDIKEMRHDIDSLRMKIVPDVIIVDYPQMMVNLSKRTLNQNLVILNQYNIEHKVLVEVCKHFKNPLKNLLYGITAKLMRLYERRLYKTKKIDLFTFVSLEDKNFFENYYKLYNTFLVPIGVEKHSFCDMVRNHKILFVGNMTYPPNIVAVEWFCSEVLPLVKNYVNDLQLYIVGKDPPEKIVNLAKKYKELVVTGTVPDITKYYNECAFVVVPLQSGGGVKVKLLEALGFGKLVLTTSKGVEGTIFTDKKHLCVENIPTDFADRCIDILINMTNYEQIRFDGYVEVANNYTWHAVAKNFELKIQELIRNGSSKNSKT